MKNVIKKFLLNILISLAKLRLKKFKCKVIDITGSVGKTTCKDALYHILKEQYKVLKSEKSFNTEFGVPLTILQQKSGFSSPSTWLKIMFSSFMKTFFNKDKFDFVILEMGVDKPGDMDILTKIVQPDFAIVTSVQEAHMADDQFKNIDEIFKEKTKLYSKINKGGVAFYNLDDEKMAALYKKHSNENSISYGTKNDSADIKASNISQSSKGISFDVHYKDKKFRLENPILGDYHVSTLLPAISVALISNVDPQKIKSSLKTYQLPPGRMTVIEGKYHTTILDSSYNASPLAVKESLKILDLVAKEKNGRRVFVFGNMNELGKNSERLHREIGHKIPDYADILITVGIDAKLAADTATKKIPNSNIIVCNDAHQAAEKYKSIIQKNDVILAKGSQNKVRLEIFVKEIMAHPEEASKLLVRQGKNWKKIAP